MFVTKFFILIKKIQIPAIIILFLSVLGCAKIGSPHGGPKDEDPPQVIKTSPPENSVNFVPKKKIDIYFDEYIQLKDIFQEMIISPPLDGNIQAIMRGKVLVIEFPEEAVFDSSTYTLSFGNAITDNNEGNVLNNYQYIFSLRAYLDSLNVEGQILNAFNHQPDKERMLVMLYKNLNDSAPLLEKPSYIARTNEEGNFAIHNISVGKYKIFGLKDANQNMIYDLPDEQIAFSDSIFEITAERFSDNIIIEDSLLYDSLVNADTLSSFLQSEIDSIEAYSNDSVLSDSILGDSIVESIYYSLNTKLFFFTPTIYNQYMTNNLRPRDELIFFSFNESLADTFELFPLNYSPANKDWFILDASANLDTLNYWITDSNMFAMDSLSMEFCYPMVDSSGIQYYKVDTFLMRAEKQKTKPARGKGSSRFSGENKEEEEISNSLDVKHSIKNTQSFDLHRNILLISPSPLEHVVFDSIRLFKMQDTLYIPVKKKVVLDTNSFYKIAIEFEPEEETSYRIFMKDSIITDIFGATNDTLEFRFKTRTLDYYGTLSINVTGVNSALLLQLMNDQEEVLMERIVQSDGYQRFEFLTPGKYMLKMIVDDNNNREWDTGDYLNKLQPEKVLYYPEIIDIRSNWEMDLNWVIEY